jgi:serine/threonine protein phosphatase PrpC
MRIEIHAASRALPGETECGDQVAIVSNQARHLVVVADGLGHGPLAAVAARKAVAFVSAHCDDDLVALLTACDRQLAGTRGAAVSVVRIDAQAATLEYAGVGNVELVALARHPIRPANNPGIIGARPRKVVAYRYQIAADDFILLFTDGISSRLDLAAYRHHDVASAAGLVLSEHGKRQDDATCVAMRCRAA